MSAVETVRLSEEQLQELARLVAFELSGAAESRAQRVVRARGQEGTAEPPGLLTAQELARRLGVSPGFVYRNASALGAIRLGDGPRARLRFDRAAAEKATRRGDSMGSQAEEAHRQAKSADRRRRRSRRLPNGLPEPGSVLAIR